ncbi:efflux transporter outer membrane subunit [Pollutimonas bauzanensis]|uniref:Efflux transporter, outer membrane factor (OMF) lipoprotein, NodT family n=1 Tax=Pollutimonas bauzanensis TaxID=658167 RepID=A0A1M5ZK99_9BURK|nr:efflux transporter outer membrane subunit [Pollutimonas bauzanensis]SHI24584.1 efflux transporter, outer membrane factor (OMF) lipoprotein, NodT family [Pollutimonas bauzanensis]
MLASTDFIPATPISRRRRLADAQALSSRKPQLPATGFAIAAAMLLAGCASTQSALIPGGAAAPVAAQWHAPLPHGGQLADMSQWWAQFDDPLMLRLIEAGQQVSPTLAQASARIADARAASVTQSAALMPSLDAGISSSRGRSELGTPIGTSYSADLQVGWELDVFGAGRAAANAAQARLESSRAGWHDARVSVAAEVATTYVELRACEAQIQLAETDAQSRARTSRVTSLAVNAGFQPPASADLASASAAQGKVALIQRRTQCDLLIRALNALTAQDEAALRRDLGTGTGLLPRPAELGVAAMPAQVLAQRPDIYAAARDVMAASAESDQARAQRWPRIALAGNIGTTRIDSGGVSAGGTVWSIGPVTVTLPLFDGGTRLANAQAARARYEAATIVYSARLREAIRDVQIALVTLDSAAMRGKDVLIAANGFERSFAAAEASYQAGTASLFELEDARRSMVAGQSAVIELHRERVSAWIALYRALGGGWSPAGVHAVRNEAAG